MNQKHEEEGQRGRGAGMEGGRGKGDLGMGWNLKTSATQELAPCQVGGGCSRPLPPTLLQLSSCPVPGCEGGED